MEGLWSSLPSYWAMAPDASLGSVACVAEAVGLPGFWVIFLSQAALPPCVLIAVSRQSSLEP